MPTAPPKHNAAASSQPARQHNKKKPWHHAIESATARGYGYQWRKARRLVIIRDSGICVPCYNRDIVTPFSDVDHIVPKAKGGTDDLDNLQCICKPCHKRKTATESRS